MTNGTKSDDLTNTLSITIHVPIETHGREPVGNLLHVPVLEGCVLQLLSHRTRVARSYAHRGPPVKPGKKPGKNPIILSHNYKTIRNDEIVSTSNTFTMVFLRIQAAACKFFAVVISQRIFEEIC